MPPKKLKTKPASTIVDPKRARASYDALKPELDAIPNDKLLALRVDAQLAAVHAYGIAQRDKATDRAEEFDKLVKGRAIGADPCDRLAQRALATWYARQQQLRFLAQGSGSVPVVTIESGEKIKKRMLRVVTHAFGDHASYALEIAAIREGSGHQDLANDLQQLADLYEIDEVHAVVSRDPVHYEKTDVADARARAAEIFAALGFETRDGAQWTARVQRAYTLLTDTYTEHCYAGSLLFFRREDVSVTYPSSLVSVVRAPRGRSEIEIPESPSTPAEPAPEPPPED